MGPGESGEPSGLPGHAASGRRASHRRGGQAVAGHDVVDQAAADGLAGRPDMRLPIAREGWPFVVAPAAIAVGLLLAGRRRLALPFAAASLLSAGFFPDPERVFPAVPRSVLSPAGGRGAGGGGG